MSKEISLKPVARYCEFPMGRFGDPSILDHAWELSKDDAAIVRYLSKEHIINYALAAHPADCFDKSRRVSAKLSRHEWDGIAMLTDGVWYWYSTLIYYVREYRVGLFADFLEYARRKKWTHVEDFDNSPEFIYL